VEQGDITERESFASSIAIQSRPNGTWVSSSGRRCQEIKSSIIIIINNYNNNNNNNNNNINLISLGSLPEREKNVTREEKDNIKLRCDERFTHAFTACSYVFKVITLV